MRKMAASYEHDKTEQVLAYVASSLNRITEEMLACADPDAAGHERYRNLLSESETLQHVVYGLEWALGKRKDWPFHADSSIKSG